MTINNTYYSIAKPLVACGIMMLTSATCAYKGIQSAKESFENRNTDTTSPEYSCSKLIKTTIYGVGCLLTGVIGRASYQILIKNIANNQIIARGGMIIDVLGKI